jgi:ABC-type antimicrobial peptide transport system permease subunit
MAMGAETSDVLKMVLRQGLTLSLTGIVVGGIASLGVTLLLTSNLAGVASPNVATYIVVPAAFIGLTVAASYFPARRASAVDPLRALRHE